MGVSIDVIDMDLQKALDKVAHKRLLNTLTVSVIGEHLLAWPGN